MPGRLLTATDVDRLQQPQTSTRVREDRARLGFSRQCNALGREVLAVARQHLASGDVAAGVQAEAGCRATPSGASTKDCFAAVNLLVSVALQADARTLPREQAEYAAARAAYLDRFPSAAETFELRDFSIVALKPVSARLVAGSGRAYSLVGDSLADWLRQ